jgi:hypothetical protein
MRTRHADGLDAAARRPECSKKLRFLPAHDIRRLSIALGKARKNAYITAFAGHGDRA